MAHQWDTQAVMEIQRYAVFAKAGGFTQLQNKSLSAVDGQGGRLTGNSMIAMTGHSIPQLNAMTEAQYANLLDQKMQSKSDPTFRNAVVRGLEANPNDPQARAFLQQQGVSSIEQYKQQLGMVTSGPATPSQPVKPVPSQPAPAQPAPAQPAPAQPTAPAQVDPTKTTRLQSLLAGNDKEFPKDQITGQPNAATTYNTNPNLSVDDNIKNQERKARETMDAVRFNELFKDADAQGGIFVNILQAILKALGFDVDITGEMDQKTTDAIPEAKAILNSRDDIINTVKAANNDDIQAIRASQGGKIALMLRVEGHRMMFDQDAIKAANGSLKALLEASPDALAALEAAKGADAKNALLSIAGISATTTPGANTTAPGTTGTTTTPGTTGATGTTTTTTASYGFTAFGTKDASGKDTIGIQTEAGTAYVDGAGQVYANSTIPVEQLKFDPAHADASTHKDTINEFLLHVANTGLADKLDDALRPYVEDSSYGIHKEHLEAVKALTGNNDVEKALDELIAIAVTAPTTGATNTATATTTPVTAAGVSAATASLQGLIAGIKDGKAGEAFSNLYEENPAIAATLAGVAGVGAIFAGSNLLWGGRTASRNRQEGKDRRATAKENKRIENAKEQAQAIIDKERTPIERGKPKDVARARTIRDVRVHMAKAYLNSAGLPANERQQAIANALAEVDDIVKRNFADVKTSGLIRPENRFFRTTKNMAASAADDVIKQVGGKLGDKAAAIRKIEPDAIRPSTVLAADTAGGAEPVANTDTDSDAKPAAADAETAADTETKPAADADTEAKPATADAETAADTETKPVAAAADAEAKPAAAEAEATTAADTETKPADSGPDTEAKPANAADAETAKPATSGSDAPRPAAAAATAVPSQGAGNSAAEIIDAQTRSAEAANEAARIASNERIEAARISSQERIAGQYINAGMTPPPPGPGPEFATAANAGVASADTAPSPDRTPPNGPVQPQPGNRATLLNEAADLDTARQAGRDAMRSYKDEVTTMLTNHAGRNNYDGLTAPQQRQYDALRLKETVAAAIAKSRNAPNSNPIPDIAKMTATAQKAAASFGADGTPHALSNTDIQNIVNDTVAQANSRINGAIDRLNLNGNGAARVNGSQRTNTVVPGILETSAGASTAQDLARLTTTVNTAQIDAYQGFAAELRNGTPETLDRATRNSMPADVLKAAEARMLAANIAEAAAEARAKGKTPEQIAQAAEQASNKKPFGRLAGTTLNGRERGTILNSVLTEMDTRAAVAQQDIMQRFSEDPDSIRTASAGSSDSRSGGRGGGIIKGGIIGLGIAAFGSVALAPSLGLASTVTGDIQELSPEAWDAAQNGNYEEAALLIRDALGADGGAADGEWMGWLAGYNNASEEQFLSILASEAARQAGDSDAAQQYYTQAGFGLTAIAGEEAMEADTLLGSTKAAGIHIGTGLGVDNIGKALNEADTGTEAAVNATLVAGGVLIDNVVVGAHSIIVGAGELGGGYIPPMEDLVRDWKYNGVLGFADFMWETQSENAFRIFTHDFGEQLNEYGVDSSAPQAVQDLATLHVQWINAEQAFEALKSQKAPWYALHDDGVNDEELDQLRKTAADAKALYETQHTAMTETGEIAWVVSYFDAMKNRHEQPAPALIADAPDNIGPEFTAQANEPETTVANNEQQKLPYTLVAYSAEQIEDGFMPIDLEATGLSIGDTITLHDSDVAENAELVSAAIKDAVMALPEVERAKFLQAAIGYYNEQPVIGQTDIPYGAVVTLYRDTLEQIQDELPDSAPALSNSAAPATDMKTGV